MDISVKNTLKKNYIKYEMYIYYVKQCYIIVINLYEKIVMCKTIKQD